MKKRVLVAIVTACVGLFSTQAKAATGYNIFAADLQLADGTLAPQNSIALVVVDTLSDGFTTVLTPGASLSLGSFLAGNDQIVGIFDLQGASLDGFLSSAFSVNYTGNITAGDNMMLFWFPTLTLSTTVLPAGAQYGFYTDPVGIDGSEPWTLPPDTGAFGLNLIFLTQSQTGSNPDLLGRATFTVIPEPSTISLVAIGILGAVALRRRRK